MRGSQSTSPGAAAGIITVVLTLLGWSSVPLFLRHFATLMDFWTSNGWRYGFSALVWAPVLVMAALNRGLPRGLWRAAVIPSIFNAVGQVCFTWAHYRIDPGLLTFGLRSQLLFVAIGAWMMFPQERPILKHPGYLVGVLLLVSGMIGVIAMKASPSDVSLIQPHVSDARHSNILQNVGMSGAERSGRYSGAIETGAAWGTPSAYAQGVALALASGLLFAAYGLSVRKYMHGVNPVLAFAAICQYTASAMVALMLLFGRDCGLAALEISGQEMVLLLLSALIGIAIGHVFYYFSLARLGVAVTAGVLQLQPFIVAVASIGLFGELLNAWQWTGGCIAVTGALLMLVVQWRLTQRRRISDKPLAIAEGESGA